MEATFAKTAQKNILEEQQKEQLPQQKDNTLGVVIIE